jgi:hypothetical protein
VRRREDKPAQTTNKPNLSRNTKIGQFGFTFHAQTNVRRLQIAVDLFSASQITETFENLQDKKKQAKKEKIRQKSKRRDETTNQ